MPFGSRSGFLVATIFWISGVKYFAKFRMKSSCDLISRILPFSQFNGNETPAAIAVASDFAAAARNCGHHLVKASAAERECAHRRSTVSQRQDRTVFIRTCSKCSTRTLRAWSQQECLLFKYQRPIWALFLTAAL